MLLNLFLFTAKSFIIEEALKKSISSREFLSTFLMNTSLPGSLAEFNKNFRGIATGHSNDPHSFHMTNYLSLQHNKKEILNEYMEILVKIFIFSVWDIFGNALGCVLQNKTNKHKHIFSMDDIGRQESILSH